MDPKTYGAWTQDSADHSWFRRDHVDGTFLRVSAVFASGYKRRWTLAWTEASGGIRIGSSLHDSAEAAMDHADATIVLTPSDKTRAA